MRLSRNILFLVGLSVFSQAALGDGPALSLHVNNDGRFEALMPKPVNDSIIEGKELTDTRYQSEAVVNNVTYRVRVQVISPIEISDEFTAQMGKSLLDQAREQHGKAANNKLKTDRVFKQHGILTGAFAYSNPTGNGMATRHRVMFDGLRLYLGSITGPENQMQTTAADSFLDSVGPKGSSAKNTSTPETKESTNLKHGSETNNQAVANLLDGKWRVDELAVQGNSQPPSNGAPDSIEIKNSNIKFFSGGKLIPTMSNVQITCNAESKVGLGEMIKVNLARPSENGREEVLPCLVKVDKDILQFALPMVNPNRDPTTPIDRPMSFDSTTGTFVVFTASKN